MQTQTAETIKQQTALPYKSAVHFTTQSRPHIRLSTPKLASVCAFYEVLFNQSPSHKGDSYVRFEVEDPPLHFTLIESEEAQPRDGHFGIQLKYTTQIKELQERLEKNNYKVELEETETTCCFSVGNRVWFTDPIGTLWEAYVLIGENTSEVRCGPDCACEAEGCG
jgi:predicted enzyme related to lactoylglutathione lyase